jgi:hypothetical protein
MRPKILNLEWCGQLKFYLLKKSVFQKALAVGVNYGEG